MCIIIKQLEIAQIFLRLLTIWCLGKLWTKRQSPKRIIFKKQQTRSVTHMHLNTLKRFRHEIYDCFPAAWMPYRMLCNDAQREGVEPSPDLASELFCYSPLHNIWYGISAACPRYICAIRFKQPLWRFFPRQLSSYLLLTIETVKMFYYALHLLCKISIFCLFLNISVLFG